MLVKVEKAAHTCQFNSGNFSTTKMYIEVDKQHDWKKSLYRMAGLLVRPSIIIRKLLTL